jgi:hypothetical protein
VAANNHIAYADVVAQIGHDPDKITPSADGSFDILYTEKSQSAESKCYAHFDPNKNCASAGSSSTYTNVSKGQ